MHDVRNLLLVAKGYARLLTEDLAPNSEERRMAQQILIALERMQTLAEAA